MTTRTHEPDIVVVGSANVDLVVPVDRLPAPGQTVLGRDHLRVAGGKGANQAVAAARLGCRVAMIGRVGDDDHGRQLLASLDEAGVDRSLVRLTPQTPSGIALITVDDAGENTIAVSPGANARLTAADVTDGAAVLRGAAVTLVQLEIDQEAVAAAVELAGGIVVLNPAPATVLADRVLRGVDVLVPNRSELAKLAGVAEPGDLAGSLAAARRLPGDAAVVVTLGSEGALVIDGDHVVHVPALEVDAVDATGAGDAFCGALADGLARGLTLERAVRWAVEVAGRSTTGWGAQPAMPTREQVRASRSGAPGSDPFVAARCVYVDAMNVIGSRPDGWWRDRDGAVRRLASRLTSFAAAREVEVMLVIDGRPVPGLPEGPAGGVHVHYATRSGRDAADDRIVELLGVADDVRGVAASTLVVTADRELGRRARALGARVVGPRHLLGLLERLPEVPG